jgi:hypothetical protein
MKKTKNGITFNEKEIVTITSALYKAYEFEKDKSHLLTADVYLRLHDEVKKYDVKKSQRDISPTASKE